MKRLTVMWFATAMLAAWLLPVAAQDAWPTRPIRVVVPFPAGGQLDVVVRIVAERIAPALGQPIVVETRLGADGNIAAELVAKSVPDGYTWLATSVPFTTQVSLQPGRLRYDPVRDFAPVASLGTASFVLVVPNSVPAATLQEFIAYARSRPGALSYAGTSVGSVTHLSTELFERATGVEMAMIPYAGIPAAMSDLIAGRTQFMSTGVIAALPQIKAGSLKPLAMLAAQRHPQLPDVPTIVEAGYPDLTVETWFGLLMPAGTPVAIVEKVNAEIMRAVQSDEVVARYRAIGVDPVRPHRPRAFGTLIGAEIDRWGKVIRAANVKVD